MKSLLAEKKDKAGENKQSIAKTTKTRLAKESRQQVSFCKAINFVYDLELISNQIADEALHGLTRNSIFSSYDLSYG